MRERAREKESGEIWVVEACGAACIWSKMVNNYQQEQSVVQGCRLARIAAPHARLCKVHRMTGALSSKSILFSILCTTADCHVVT